MKQGHQKKIGMKESGTVLLEKNVLGELARKQINKEILGRISFQNVIFFVMNVMLGKFCNE